MENNLPLHIDKTFTLVEFEALTYSGKLIFFSREIEHKSDLDVYAHLDNTDLTCLMNELELSTIINYEVDDLHVFINNLMLDGGISEEFMANVVSVFNELNTSKTNRILSKLSRRETFQLTLDTLMISLKSVEQAYKNLSEITLHDRLK